MNEITLYIVEDEPLTRKTYEHYFSNMCGVKTLKLFETAEECLEMLAKNQSAIILMDLGLPAMNGIAATKIINEKYPSAKIIILTSHDKKYELFASLACGAKAYVIKDTSLEDIENVIKEVQKGNIWLDKRIAETALHIFPLPENTENCDSLYSPSNTEHKFELTEREYEITKLIALKGMSNPEIARHLHISEHTVKSHVKKILVKFNVPDRVLLAVKAVSLDMF